MTTAQRARKRATASRLRAIYHHPGRNTTGNLPFKHGHYTVHNLREHRKYTVYCRAEGDQHAVCNWQCHCEAAKARVRCKHVQRVLDREEQRIRKEALAHG